MEEDADGPAQRTSETRVTELIKKTNGEEQVKLPG